jgi:RES domain-containing protein
LPVVYLAESPAGALLEACIHTSANDVPPNYTLLEIAVEAAISLEELSASRLPAGWIEHVEVTREIGTSWLREQRSCLLRIPSALVPVTFNVLVNPLHGDAACIRIQSAVIHPFDSRIKK